MSINIKDLIQFGKKELNNISNTPLLDTRIIVSHFLEKSETYLITHEEVEVSKELEDIIKKNIEKRKNHYPIAYITNKKEFYGRDFYIDKNVLIPRPETEELIEYVLKIIKNDFDSNLIKILDLGTGSGCIAITLKKELEQQTRSRDLAYREEISKINIYASDISTKALGIAKRNAENHKVDIKFFQSDLLEKFPKKYFDLIIANLPYIEDSWNHPSIKHEPNTALFSGKDGLDHYRRLSKQVSSENCENLILEIGDNQVTEIKKIFSFTKDVKIIKDLGNINRIVHIKF